MDVEIGDTLITLADAGDLQDGIGLCRSLARKPNKGEDREKLRAVARKLTERFPDEPALQIAVATMLLRSGTLLEAHEQLRSIKRSFPEEDRVHELLGEVLLRMGDARGAVVAFERALTMHADVPVEEVLVEARVLGRTQDTKGVAHVAQEVRSILGDPSEPLAVRRRGLSDVKTPIVHDVRAMMDEHLGSSAPPAHRSSSNAPGHRPSSGAPPLRPHSSSSQASGSQASGSQASGSRASGSNAPPPHRGVIGSQRPPGSPLRLGGGVSVPPGGSARPGMVSARPPSALSVSASVPPPDMPHLRAKAEDPTVSRRGWIVGGAAGVALLALGGLAAARWSEGFGFDRAVVGLAVEAMLTARPSQLDRATTFTRRVMAQAPRSSEAGVRALQASVLALLDGNESRGGLAAAIDDARARGAAPPELATGEALALLIGGDVTAAKARLENVVPGDHPIDAVVLHLVRGVVLERAGDPTARDAYEAAVKAEPRSVAALVRLARMWIAEGDGEAASASFQRLAALDGDMASLVGDLDAIAQHAGVPVQGRAVKPSPARRLGDDGPRSLRAASIAVEASGAADAAQANAMLGAAVLAAETPSDAALIGRIALRRGADGAAALAVTKAAELGPNDPRAAFLAAELAFARGDLRQVEELARKLPARAAAACAGLLAYERGDLTALRDVAPKASSAHAAALGLAVARLEAARPLDAAALARLATGEGPFGALVAIDAWLDRGAAADLDAADELAARRWPTPPRGALAAVRRARSLRLRGDRAGARAALAETSALSTPQALLEALLTREDADAASLAARVASAPEPARLWLQALERATADKDADAKKLLKDATVPAAAAGLVVRLAAAHALTAVGDGRAKVITQEIVAAFPDNRDLGRDKRKAPRGGGGRGGPVAAASSDSTYE